MKTAIRIAAMILSVSLVLGCNAKKTAAFANQQDMVVPAPATAVAAADSPAAKTGALVPQKTCPVMGNQIDKSQYVDYQNKRIYLCCAGCKAEVAKDPEKYLKKLAEMGEAVESIQK